MKALCQKNVLYVPSHGQNTRALCPFESGHRQFRPENVEAKDMLTFRICFPPIVPFLSVTACYL